jgi:ATP-dependent DNA helicase RecQ
MERVQPLLTFRAGRDGAPAEAHMVFGLSDIQMRRRFIDQEEGGDERRRREHKRLDALVAYCEAPECRRQALLAYFGEFSEPCGNCDVCLDPTSLVDGSDQARLALELVRVTGERFGAAHIADLLTGKPNEKALALKHDQLPLFGAGKPFSRGEWLALLRQLAGGGYLLLDVAGFGGFSLATKGRALLKGDGEFRYRPVAPRRTKKAKRAARMVEAVERDGVSDVLLSRLKSLRAKLAKERRVPAYVIFSDRSLIDMAAKRPLTKWDFGEVHGVGDAKQREFGDIFLREIRDAVESLQASRKAG